MLRGGDVSVSGLSFFPFLGCLPAFQCNLQSGESSQRSGQVWASANGSITNNVVVFFNQGSLHKLRVCSVSPVRTEKFFCGPPVGGDACQHVVGFARVPAGLGVESPLAQFAVCKREYTWDKLRMSGVCCSLAAAALIWMWCCYSRSVVCKYNERSSSTVCWNYQLRSLTWAVSWKCFHNWKFLSPSHCLQRSVEHKWCISVPFMRILSPPSVALLSGSANLNVGWFKITTNAERLRGGCSELLSSSARLRFTDCTEVRSY